MGRKRKKKSRTIRQIQEILKKPIVPRMGVHPTKKFKDKSKYTRKIKHKGKVDE